MSAIFNYTLFTGLLLLVMSIGYVAVTKKIKDVRVNPLIVFLGAFFLMSLWLADLTTLDMAVNGASSVSGLVPTAQSRIPNIVIYTFVVSGMVVIHGVQQRVKRGSKKKQNVSINSLLLISQLIGLVIFTVASMLLIFLGHNSTLGGFYILGVYHSALPLLIIPQLFLLLTLK